MCWRRTRSACASACASARPEPPLRAFLAPTDERPQMDATRRRDLSENRIESLPLGTFDFDQLTNLTHLCVCAFPARSGRSPRRRLALNGSAEDARAACAARCCGTRRARMGRTHSHTASSARLAPAVFTHPTRMLLRAQKSHWKRVPLSGPDEERDLPQCSQLRAPLALALRALRDDVELRASRCRARPFHAEGDVWQRWGVHLRAQLPHAEVRRQKCVRS